MVRQAQQTFASTTANSRKSKTSGDDATTTAPISFFIMEQQKEDPWVYGVRVRSEVCTCHILLGKHEATQYESRRRTSMHRNKQLLEVNMAAQHQEP